MIMNIKNYRLTLEEICNVICKKIGTNDIEFMDNVEVDGVLYALEEEYECDVNDEGKCQYGGTVFKVGVADEDGYSIKENSEVEFFIKQDFSRSGSYHTDYYYEHEKPYQVELRQIVRDEWVAV